MLYWPLSQIMNDPLLHHAYARELRVAYHKRPDIGTRREYGNDARLLAKHSVGGTALYR